MIDNIGNNKGLFGAIGKTLTETYKSGEAFGSHYSHDDSAAGIPPPADKSEAAARSAAPYHADYDSEHGYYNVKHRESGRVVARNVAVSGGAALAAADHYNRNPHKDTVAHPTTDSLLDLAHSVHQWKHASAINDAAPLHSYSLGKQMKDHVAKLSSHLDTAHATFAKQNPDHEFADRKAFDEHSHSVFKSELEDHMKQERW